MRQVRTLTKTNEISFPADQEFVRVCASVCGTPPQPVRGSRPVLAYTGGSLLFTPVFYTAFLVTPATGVRYVRRLRSQARRFPKPCGSPRSPPLRRHKAALLVRPA